MAKVEGGVRLTPPPPSRLRVTIFFKKASRVKRWGPCHELPKEMNSVVVYFQSLGTVITTEVCILS